ncbi:hypothetical protein LguiA_026877 [Lonicera macranthoides]
MCKNPSPNFSLTLNFEINYLKLAPVLRYILLNICVFNYKRKMLEARFIQEIIKVVKHKLDRHILYVGRHLVGMQSRAKNIDSWVQNNSSSEDILVICGMGGIGKTTIAKFSYNSNAQRFEGNCFLGSVAEKSQQPNGLVNLKAQLLSSILKGKRKKNLTLTKINEAMYCKRILIVKDNVDEVEQLNALLGKRVFYPGSKIIITTRNKSLLKAHEVHKLHTVQVLDFYESLELLCWHAFGKEYPDEGYREQSERAVYHCGGLPLDHKILGSSLAEKSSKVWDSMLNTDNKLMMHKLHQDTGRQIIDQESPNDPGET